MNCKKCGAEQTTHFPATGQMVESFVFACKSMTQGEHLMESIDCVRRQLAQSEAAVAKLVEALERRLKTEESQAAMRAIASGLGVSEWPAFVSESFFDDCAALAEFHGRKA